MSMPAQKPDKTNAQELLNRFMKIQQIRQRSLEILLRVDKKIGDFKYYKLKNKLEELTK